MKSRFAIINEIIDSDDGFVRFHFSAHTKGALLYIASCYVVRTTIKAKLHFAAWLLRLSKNMRNSWMTEQQGKSEGGKEPPSRSINQFFEL